MIQLPFPTADSAAIEVQLPSAFEQWRDTYLHDVGEKLVVFLILALLLHLLARLAKRQTRVSIEEINRRHTIRKWISYGYVVLLILIGIALFANSLVGLGTFLALVVAGLAVALQDILKSVVGWIYLSGRSGIRVGSRLEVDGTMGDVIDIGVLKTTLIEVGKRVHGEQSTGRIVTVPNFLMLSASVFSSGVENPFVWSELRITVTYESDWERAEAIVREVAAELHAEIAAEVDAGFGRMNRRYAFKYGTLTPIVYVSMGDSGIHLTLRFLRRARAQRGSLDRISRRVLAAFAREPRVELAYPTYRVYRQGEEDTGDEGAAQKM